MGFIAQERGVLATGGLVVQRGDYRARLGGNVEFGYIPILTIIIRVTDGRRLDFLKGGVGETARRDAIIAVNGVVNGKVEAGTFRQTQGRGQFSMQFDRFDLV